MSASVHSLKKRILLPLLLVLIAALSLMAVAHAKSFKADLTSRLRERAEHISSLIRFIGGSTPKVAELRHLVGALGGEPEVNLVVVLAGNPARVVASSRMAMVGRSLEEMTDFQDKEDLQMVTTVAANAFRFDKDGGEFDYFGPLSVSVNGPGGNELDRGAVLVSLDTHYLQAQVVRTTGIAIAGYVSIVLVLACFCWLLLHRHVLKPLGLISQAMADFHAGDRGRLMDTTLYSGELGQLAGAWNELVDRLQKEHAVRNQVEKALHASREELEARVIERTKELETANEALQTENFERKQAEKTSQESEEKFRQMAENITDLFWIASPELDAVHYVSPGWERMIGTTRESLYARPEQWIECIFPEDRKSVLETFGALLATEPEAHIEYRVVRPDGEIRWVHGRGFQVKDDAGRVVRLTGIVTDITEQKRAEEELRWKTALLEAQVDSYAVGILVVDNHGRKILQNRRMNELWKIPREIAEDSDDGPQLEFVRTRNKDPEGFAAKVAYLVAQPDETSVDELETIDGLILDRYSAPVVGKDGRRYGRIWTFADITDRKLAETETERLNMKLVDASRLAGMAEVATSVLHNIGNVLNSVNISVTMAAETTRQSCGGDLTRIAALLQAHRANLPEFLRSTQGVQLPDFLTSLAQQLGGEQKRVLIELESLGTHIDHIKEIVEMQQTYARRAGLSEQLSAESLVEDAIRLNSAAFDRHGVRVIRDYGETPMLEVDKHKALQILVNLIRNAKYAMDEPGATGKDLTLRIRHDGAALAEISVCDEGVGIPPENLTRIFQHGFTTRKEGHGFGLHSAALAAREMGGSLIAQSAGTGLGARFTLSLPLLPPHSSL
jgi:PAS domain S-box-containing protein